MSEPGEQIKLLKDDDYAKVGSHSTILNDF